MSKEKTPYCTILVRLWQMHPSDQQQLVIKTLNLFEADYETVCLNEWPARKQFNSLEFPGGVEYFVLDGNFSDDDDTYSKGSWLRLPAGSTQNITVNTKTRILCETGHLLNPVIYA